MSGAELIEWAVAQCDKAGTPPTDGAILDFIRSLRQTTPQGGKDAAPVGGGKP